MIIFTNVRKSIDYKDFITQNVHPAESSKLVIMHKESVELTFVYLSEGCGKTLVEINGTIPHTRIDMGYWGT